MYNRDRENKIIIKNNTKRITDRNSIYIKTKYERFENVHDSIR